MPILLGASSISVGRPVIISGINESLPKQLGRRRTVVIFKFICEFSHREFPRMEIKTHPWNLWKRRKLKTKQVTALIKTERASHTDRQIFIEMLNSACKNKTKSRRFFFQFTGFQNLRVGRRFQTILETRDHNNGRLPRGGEIVSVELRHKETGTSRSLHVQVEDRRDGSYMLSLIPDAPGKLLLSVYVKGLPIKVTSFKQSFK